MEDTRTTPIRHSRTVAAGADEVYRLLSSVRSRPTWMRELEWAEAPERPVEAGDHFEGRASLLGHRFLGRAEVVEASGTRLVERVVIGARFTSTWTVTPQHPRGTLVEHHLQLEFPRGPLGALERLVLRRRLTAMLASSLDSLAAAVDGDRPAASSTLSRSRDRRSDRRPRWRWWSRRRG